MKRRTVVLGFLGSTLDMGGGAKRWDRWRPTVAMTQHDDLAIDRIELFHGREHTRLAQDVTADIALTSPQTCVNLQRLQIQDAWDFESVYGALFEFAKSYPFEPEHEDYLVHITTGSHVAQICLFLLIESRHIPARLLQTSPSGGRSGRRGKEGTRSLHRSAEGTYAIIDLDLSKYDALARRFQREHAQSLSVLKSGIATHNAAFNRLIEEVEHVAVHSKAPILLTGNTGSGKSQLAKQIFGLKKARHLVSGEFVEVNCATLRGDAAMSMLFGHKRGAFTGALTDRTGLLRLANGGVLFLDEIGELGLDEQAMLLRAIEEGVFYPMGADKPVKSSFQLLTGTNRDLASQVRRGAFRADLYARINLWTFRLPNLCERVEDVAPNLDFELARASELTGMNITMRTQARAAFLAFARTWPWPGNFRDFNASITRMATFAGKQGGLIGTDEVEHEVARLTVHMPERNEDASLCAKVLGERLKDVDLFDRAQLEEVLRVCQRSASISEAGRVLFAVSRTKKTSSNDTDRLRKFLARFDIEFSMLRDTHGAHATE